MSKKVVLLFSKTFLKFAVNIFNQLGGILKKCRLYCVCEETALFIAFLLQLITLLLLVAHVDAKPTVFITI
jgi:hypothetical protein